MKKMISFTIAALLAVTTYSLADESTIVSEDEALAELALVVENTAEPEFVAEQETPKAENVQPSAAVASRAAMAPNAPTAQTAPRAQRPQNPRALTRKEIRSMDILDRPNRPGHFYGNTVRRRHGR